MEAEQILQKTSCFDYLANCLLNKSLVLMKLGRAAESMPMCLKAQILAEQNDLSELLDRIDSYMKSIQSKMGW